MKLPRRRFLRLATGAAALLAVSRIAWAQNYPTRPITMIVPFPAGGPLDTIARIVVEGMRGSASQPIVIENVPGAAGTIGVGRVAPQRLMDIPLLSASWERMLSMVQSTRFNMTF